MIRRNIVWLLGIMIVSIATATAWGQNQSGAYPIKPLRLIVPWVAAGSTDLVARIIAVKFTEALGQQVLVDNRPGANGIIGSEIAAKATPDGYTMILESVEHVINASTYSKLPYDTIKDFAPVGLVAAHSLVLVVNPSFPAKTVKELVALAKSKPRELNFGSWGEGSIAHLSGEMLKTMAGINMVHVPYKGLPQAITDILGGRLSLTFATIPTGMPFIKSSKLRALAVTSGKPVPVVPEVPTMIESGYPGFEVESWRGMFVPAGTSKKIISRLNSELVKVLQMPDVRERLTATGFDSIPSGPEQLEAFSKAELVKWAKVAKGARVRVE